MAFPSKLRRLASTLAGCAVLLSATACHSYPEDNRACGLQFRWPDPPVQRRATGPFVYGRIMVSCNPRPTVHRMYMFLEHRRVDLDAEWRVEDDKFSDDIPPSVGRADYVLMAPCKPGQWRMRVRITGSFGPQPFEPFEAETNGREGDPQPLEITEEDCREK